MKTTQESKIVYEYRIEEVAKLLIPNKTATVDYDTITMRLKDGSMVLLLEISKVATS